MINNRYISIIPHANADPDALSSSCSLAYMINILNNNALLNILAPEGIGSECNKILNICLANKINIAIAKRSSINLIHEGSLCILVDVASIEQLKIFKSYLNLCNYIVIIDHHEMHSHDLILDNHKAELILKVICPEALSTAEIIFEISKCLGISLSVELLETLIAGILWDTKRFLRASAPTFKLLSEIIELGANYDRARELISVSKPYHSRIAKIKCLLRHRGFKASFPFNDIYIALSEIGAYESECASALVGIGYDIVFVASEEDVFNAVRIVYRAREDLNILQQINIYNDILKRIIQKYGGGGGGHKSAGGAIINTSNIDLVLREIIEILATMPNINLTELVEHKIFEG